MTAANFFILDNHLYLITLLLFKKETMTDLKELLTEKMKYIGEFGISIDDRIIHVYDELDENIGSILRIKYELIKEYWKTAKPDESFNDITLDICSGGGSIYAINACLDFFYELGLSGVKVNTRAHGYCMSAATVVLAGGTGERVSLPNCKFMLHDVQIDGIGGTANQVKHNAQIISDEQMELFSLYAKFSRRGEEELSEKDLAKEAKKWQKKFTKDSFDHYITAKSVLEMKLIDKIL